MPAQTIRDRSLKVAVIDIRSLSDVVETKSVALGTAESDIDTLQTDMTAAESDIVDLQSAGSGITIVVLTLDYDVLASDSGTHFILNTTQGMDIELPTPAANLEYWFTIGLTEPNTSHAIRPASGNIIQGVVSTSDIDGSNPAQSTAANLVQFKGSNAKAGDYCHFWSDGSTWFLDGMCRNAIGITTAQA